MLAPDATLDGDRRAGGGGEHRSEAALGPAGIPGELAEQVRLKRRVRSRPRRGAVPGLGEALYPASARPEHVTSGQPCVTTAIGEPGHRKHS